MNNYTRSFYLVKARKTIHQWLCFFVLVLTVWNADAATLTSQMSGNLKDADTWGGVAPQNGDVLIIASGHTVTVNSSFSQSLTTITINNGGVMTGGSNINGLASLTIDSGGTCNTTGDVIVSGTISVSGSMNLTNGANRTITAGSLLVASGGSLTTNANISISGTLTISGSVIINNDVLGRSTILSDVVLNSGASFTGVTGIHTRATTISGNFTNNAAAFSDTNPGTVSFTGTGKTISGSTTTSFSNVVVTGTLAVASGAKLTATTTLAGAGTLTNNGTLTIGGTSTITGLVATALGNTVNYNAAGNQTIITVVYNNLVLSGGGVKTINTAASGTLTTDNFSIAHTGTAIAGVTNANIQVGSLALGGVGQVTGTYGSTTSGATNQSDTFFTASGYVNSGKAAQTITFGALTPVTYGDANFNLTATASSGLAVTYVSSNTAVATVSGSTVTIVSVGSAFITASQGGNASFDPAIDIIQTLTVNPKALTIAGALANSKVYDGTNEAVVTGTLTGVINSDSVTLVGTGTFATVNVGTGIAVTSTSTLTGAKANNYILTQPTGLTADITKANQNISFVGPLKNYEGFADFIPPARSGANTITFVSSNPAVATIVGGKVHYVGLGTTTITASQAATTNYNAASDVSQTLTVMLYPIAAWNFWTPATETQYTKAAYIFDSGLDAVSSIPIPNIISVNSADGTVSSVSSNTISRGAGVTATGGTSAFRSNGFPINAPTPPLVNAANTDYFQITIRATAGKTVSLSTIDAFFYDSGNGFNTAPGAISQFGYSLDGGTTIVPIGSPVQSTVLRMGQIDVSGIAALQDVPSTTTITLRYYASGYAAQGWGFGSPNQIVPAATAGIAATDGLVIGGDVADSTTWTGTASGGSWSSGTPSATKNAIILGDFDTSISTGGGFTAKKLTINSGSLTIKGGTTVTVVNQVINNVGANAIIVENSASLVQVRDFTASSNVGDITYSRETTPISNMDYTYWSSPVAGFTLGGVSPNTAGDKFYSFDSVANNWKQESVATLMNPGVGYIIRGPQTSGYIAPNPKAIYTATFVGVPNNGGYQVTGVLANKTYLLGNPYPSALDADTFIDANQNILSGALYFWTHNTNIGIGVSNPGSGVYAYSGDDYASYTRTGGVSTAKQAPSSVPPLTGANANTPSGKIASGQGFFATTKATPTATVIDYRNDMRVGVGGITGNNSQFFKTRNTQERVAKTIEKHRIWLDLTNTQGLFKQILVGYITDATNEYDDIFDGKSLNANPYANFYSINQDKKLAIQGRALPFDEKDEVVLGFKTTLTGPLTISISNTDGLLVNQAVFLEDKLTNMLIDLKKENYTFDTLPGTFDDRFVLHYVNAKTLGLDEISLIEDIIVYRSNGMIYIKTNDEVLANVKLYDVLGKLLIEQKNILTTATAIKELKETKQVLVVKATSKSGSVYTKKLIY